MWLFPLNSKGQITVSSIKQLYLNGIFTKEFSTPHYAKTNRFYSEIGYIENVRSSLKGFTESNGYTATLENEIFDDHVHEVYTFYDQLHEKILSVYVKGYSVDAIHRRIINEPKNIYKLTKFCNTLSLTSKLLDSILPLIMKIYSIGGNDFMLDFFEDENESYVTFEAIKSKLTLEMIVYHKQTS